MSVMDTSDSIPRYLIMLCFEVFFLASQVLFTKYRYFCPRMDFTLKYAMNNILLWYLIRLRTLMSTKVIWKKSNNFETGSTMK